MEENRHCLNCKHQLDDANKFCANCGQKVDSNNLTLKAVFTEFYENYLSFDTRMGRSVIPFLFRPGTLTREFVQGRRISFMNPFRFYLIISILFFFLLGITVDDQINTSKKGVIEVGGGTLLNNENQKNQKNQLVHIGEILDSLSQTDSTLTQRQVDSIIAENKLDNISFKVDDDSTKKRKSTKIQFGSEASSFNLDLEDFEVLKKYQYNKDYSDLQLLDSVNGGNLEEFQRHMALQGIKLYRSDSKEIMRFVIGNYSIAMFVLIPAFALLLGLFYYRNKQPYVVHLIHSLQLHTFAFFIYSLALIIVHFFLWKFALIIAFLISVFYMYKSFRLVYSKSRIGTFFRLAGVGILYYFIWVTTIIGGLFISFLLF